MESAGGPEGVTSLDDPENEIDDPDTEDPPEGTWDITTKSWSNVWPKRRDFWDFLKSGYFFVLILICRYHNFRGVRIYVLLANECTELL